MALRFRKRVKLLPGLWLNVGKSGISTSVGTTGVRINLKDGAARTTISAPGTGISYSSTVRPSGDKPNVGRGAAYILLIVLLACVLGYLALR